MALSPQYPINPDHRVWYIRRMDDPKQIAAYLAQEYGLDGAIDAAVKGTAEAHMEGDNYSLSIWREVKAILRSMGPLDRVGQGERRRRSA